MRFGYQSGWRSPGRQTDRQTQAGGLDGESALQAARNTPSLRVLGWQPRLGEQGRGQRTVTTRPLGEPGQPCAEAVEGLREGGVAA